ncbi:MAG TPA: hypothetical protein VFS21_09850 [Roseiflexaceae bacterium]|nr:hypothetical protein [Roseiflexaceae bacterium]
MESKAVEIKPYPGVREVGGFAVPVYASVRMSGRARELATRFEQAYRWLGALLAATPPIGLIVLSNRDWKRNTESAPGGSFYSHSRHAVVVAGEVPRFLRPVLALLRSSEPGLYAPVQATYHRQSMLDLSPHTDLWPIHDLGHALHINAGIRFPRVWLTELFASLCLVAYVGAVEPQRRAALEAFPLALGRMPARLFARRSLAEFEAHYADMPLENYLWYRCRLLRRAVSLNAKSGPAALLGLWERFLVPCLDGLSDAALLPVLRDVHPDLALLVEQWDVPEG